MPRRALANLGVAGIVVGTTMLFAVVHVVVPLRELMPMVTSITPSNEVSMPRTGRRNRNRQQDCSLQ